MYFKQAFGLAATLYLSGITALPIIPDGKLTDPSSINTRGKIPDPTNINAREIDDPTNINARGIPDPTNINAREINDPTNINARGKLFRSH